MLKLQLFILTFCIHCCLLAQKETINFTDSQGRKQGHWIYFGKDRPESGIPLDGKVEEGDYLDDRKTGLWTKYHDDGVTPKIRGCYENNRPKGNYTKYWENCEIREKGNFERNLQLDSLLRYFNNGNMHYEGWYNENGKENGIVNYYFENGKLDYTLKAKNGTPIDTAYHYYNNGDLKAMTIYNDKGEVMKEQQYEAVRPLEIIASKKEPSTPPDLSKMPGSFTADKLPTGFHRIYNDKGELWLDGIFKEGKLLNGKQYIYDNDGILLKVKVYKEGEQPVDKK